MNQLQKIAIINYNSGNITSLENSLKRLNYKPKIIKNGHDLINYNPTTVLRDGLEMTWKWFLDNQDEFKYKKNYFSEESKVS